MSNIQNTKQALVELGNIRKNLSLYRVGKNDEAKELPQSIWTEPQELRALNHLVELADAFTKGFTFIAISGWGWAKNSNPIQAFASCRKDAPRGTHHSRKSNIKLYLAHPDTEVFGDGTWSYPAGFEPVQVNTAQKSIA